MRAPASRPPSTAGCGRSTTAWAVAPDVVVLRYIADRPGAAPQRFEGVAAVNAWLERGPSGQSSVTLVPGTLAVREEGGEGGVRLVGEARYEVNVTDWIRRDATWVAVPFRNQGTWRATLAE